MYIIIILYCYHENFLKNIKNQKKYEKIKNHKITLRLNVTHFLSNDNNESCTYGNDLKWLFFYFIFKFEIHNLHTQSLEIVHKLNTLIQTQGRFCIQSTHFIRKPYKEGVVFPRELAYAFQLTEIDA